MKTKQVVVMILVFAAGISSSAHCEDVYVSVGHKPGIDPQQGPAGAVVHEPVVVESGRLQRDLRLGERRFG